MDEEHIKLKKRLYQSYASIESLVLIQQQIMDSSAQKVIINIVDTTYIADGLLLLLAALPDFSKIYGKKIIIRYNKNNVKISRFLRESGVLYYYMPDSQEKPEANSIPFCKTNDVGKYRELVRRIMELAPVEFNSKSYSTMFSKLYEVFINAGTHGNNKLGTYTYGNLHNDNFVFTVYDAGSGIRNNVNDFLKGDYSSLETMKWALTCGNSTSQSDYPRGAGFTLLENFVAKNKGKITLCSDDIICILENGERRFHCMKTRIRGTLFIMNIKADSEYIYDM